MKPKNKYRVSGTYFDDLGAAVQKAKSIAMAKANFTSAFSLVMDMELNVFVACVTDDANGVTVNKLYGWPAGVEV